MASCDQGGPIITENVLCRFDGQVTDDNLATDNIRPHQCVISDGFSDTRGHILRLEVK